MSAPFLNLIVIRVPDIEEAQRFYSLFGFSFTKHAHGSGPVHYAAESNSQVFEIYPQSDVEGSTKSTRIGFKVQGLDALVARLVTGGAKVVSPVKNSPWGRRAVVTDLVGHKLELVEDESRKPQSG